MQLLEKISWLKTRIQENLFPYLRECLDDPLLQKQKNLTMTLEIVQIEKYVQHPNESWTGRPPEDRISLARSKFQNLLCNLPHDYPDGFLNT